MATILAVMQHQRQHNGNNNHNNNKVKILFSSVEGKISTDSGLVSGAHQLLLPPVTIFSSNSGQKFFRNFDISMLFFVGAVITGIFEIFSDLHLI